MSDFNFLELYAKFAGFRIMVLANRLGCKDAFSRAAHDTLLIKLDEFISLSQAGLAARQQLALKPVNPEDFAEEIWSIEQQFIDIWSDPEGINLLPCDVYVDWTTKEWHDARRGSWHSLHDFPAPRVEVGDALLDGLCVIIRQIETETSIRFDTYTTDPSFPDDEDVGDPECFEALHGGEG